MDFGEAIKTLKHGGRCARRGWNGQGMYIELQEPGANMRPEWEDFL